MPSDSIDARITSLAHAVGLVMRRVRATTAADGFTLTESAVIARLARDGAMTTAELARLEGMRPQSMRTTITALDRLGMIDRKPHKTDGRQVLIALSRRGMDRRKTKQDTKHSWLASAIAQLPAADRETLFAAGDIMLRLAEQ